MDLDEAAAVFREFVSVIKALRTPGTGCPWDLEQDHRTLRRYVVEETCEVLDAIDAGADGALREELGDLLLQVVLHAQLADDRGAFSLTDVVKGITEKMVRRHPHVFGTDQVSSSAEVLRNWERIKAAEAEEKGAAASLDRLPATLPALLRAQRIAERAAKAGLDRGSAREAFDRAREALAGLEELIPGAERAAASAGDAPARPVQGPSNEEDLRLEERFGDLLFSLCRLARWLGLNAEDSLRAAAGRFADHFRRPERPASP
jgi:MazG family protein